MEEEVLDDEMTSNASENITAEVKKTTGISKI